MYLEVLIALGVGISIPCIIMLWNNLWRLKWKNQMINAHCSKCACKLGEEVYNNALQKHKVRLNALKASGSPTVVWRNLELFCPECGAKNYEADICHLKQKGNKVKDSE